MGPRRSNTERVVAMKDVQILLRKEEFVLAMVLRRNNAAMMVVHILL